MLKTNKIINVKHRHKSLRSVRESYLRLDVCCYSAVCKSCGYRNFREGNLNLLSASSSHYVIPCYDVVQRYVELLELPGISGIIFLQSIITQVLHDVSRRHYNRILEMTCDPKHECVIFLNELHQKTHLLQEKGESKQHWLLRCTYKVARWYNEHLNGAIPIVLLHENNQVTVESLCDNVPTMNIERYLEKFWPDLKIAHSLYDSIRSSFQNDVIEDNTKRYPNHLKQSELENGIRDGEFFRGIIKVDKYHPQDEAYVSVSRLSEKILIPGMKLRNRAIHGDDVVVKLLETVKWKGKICSLKPPPLEGEEQDYADVKNDDKMPTGEVVGIFQRCWRDYVACFPEAEENGGKTTKSSERVLVIPYDHRIPKIRIATRHAEKFSNERIIVRIDNWEANSQYPNGHFVQCLGEISNIETEIAALLAEHQIFIHPFSEALLSELPENTPDKPWCVQEDEILKRRDLRDSHLIFSIDPKECTDVDDAISLSELDSGNVELGVHIADVTHFIKPAMLTDTEAKIRSRSVYLADRRYNMLPPVLSENLCSLMKGKDRYAVSVIWELDINCNVINVWFGRTVIRSAYKLFYEAAQEIIDGSSPKLLKQSVSEWNDLNEQDLQVKYEKIRTILLKLRNITRVLKSNREKNGALEFDMSEVQFEFRRDGTKLVEKLETKEHLEIHAVIAECMIFANQWVAKRICEKHPHHSLLRCHPPPLVEKLKKLEIAASSKKFKFDFSSNITFAQSLKCAFDKRDSSFNLILNMLAIQGMSRAEYISTGAYPPEEWSHYALALDKYTHFTSPIRRYADILVHRLLLEENGDAENSVMTSSQLQTCCDHMNERHIAAQLLQKESIKLFQVLYFKDKQLNDSENSIDAVIYSILANGLLVFVPSYGIKGPVYLRNKEKQVLIISEDGAKWTSGTISISDFELTVTSDTCQQTYKLFDHVMIAIKVQSSRAHMPRFIFDLISNKPPLLISEESIELKDAETVELELSPEKSQENNKILEENCHLPSDSHAHPKSPLYDMFQSLRNLSLH